MLDFLADHVDYDYTVSQLEEFTGISRPTIYRLIGELEAEKMISLKREVGASNFYGLNTQNEKVITMLHLDFEAINKSLLEQSAPPSRTISPGRIGLSARRVVLGQPRHAALVTPQRLVVGGMKAMKAKKKGRK